MRKPYMAPDDSERCIANRKPLADGSLARCMHRATVGNLCKQHAKMAAEFECDYCGGNDEIPQDHCMDCMRPKT